MAKSLIRVDGTGKVVNAIRAHSLKGAKVMSLDVGYETPYAAKIHEDLSLFHPHGQAKYLEAPARRYSREMGDLFYKRLQQKRSMKDALLECGNFLLARSRPLVPVLTGALRDSGFVRVE